MMQRAATKYIAVIMVPRQNVVLLNNYLLILSVIHMKQTLSESSTSSLLAQMETKSDYNTHNG